MAFLSPIFASKPAHLASLEEYIPLSDSFAQIGKNNYCYVTFSRLNDAYVPKVQQSRTFNLNKETIQKVIAFFQENAEHLLAYLERDMEQAYADQHLPHKMLTECTLTDSDKPLEKLVPPIRINMAIKPIKRLMNIIVTKHMGSELFNQCEQLKLRVREFKLKEYIKQEVEGFLPAHRQLSEAKAEFATLKKQNQEKIESFTQDLKTRYEGHIAEAKAQVHADWENRVVSYIALTTQELDEKIAKLRAEKDSLEKKYEQLTQT